MRYKETGEVHMDFHKVANATIRYLRTHYGDAFLDEVLRRTAHDVYRSIHDDLKRGDPDQLVAHWTYFFDREGGDYSLEREGDEIRLTVKQCPAIGHLKKKGVEMDPSFCRQTVVLNEALSEGTPFEIRTQVQGDGRCIQTVRRTRT